MVFATVAAAEQIKKRKTKKKTKLKIKISNGIRNPFRNLIKHEIRTTAFFVQPTANTNERRMAHSFSFLQELALRLIDFQTFS